MKAILKYTFAVLVTLTYLVSVVGVSVYHCHCTHSNQLVWLADGDCECAHAHHHQSAESTCGHHCSAEEHADDDTLFDGCCTIAIEQLDTDHEVPVTPKTITDFLSAHTLYIYIPATIVLPPPALTASLHTPPPQWSGDTQVLLSQMAQWRL